ncbi:DUF2147 domain-containing protein [Pontivivens nitratireducens]|uniref:DUF2147 domain-containing protein n=1 Tax=Pontivivens nitratireducens TaxID=2758038 RepID=UPI001639AE86|nr:DUF2147 domain-containing protein [Pontibrevibacter nitratireducens]
MKKIILATALVLAAPLAAQAQDINGMWQSEPGETGSYVTVAIDNCAANTAQTCGTITGVFEADGSAGDQAIVGKPIIWDMQPTNPGNWAQGTIWAPDQDKTYDSKMSLSGNTLEVSGCVLFICRSQNWTRMN